MLTGCSGWKHGAKMLANCFVHCRLWLIYGELNPCPYALVCWLAIINTRNLGRCVCSSVVPRNIKPLYKYTNSPENNVSANVPRNARGSALKWSSCLFTISRKRRKGAQGYDSERAIKIKTAWTLETRCWKGTWVKVKSKDHWNAPQKRIYSG